ncbi:MurR/RpiR family transcriptional regulator [Pseudonocardia sp. C8]|uniref:MurR/RpiR family transcriptional regulator n=1 Tax=Pseudonocardia sp. C8 TaxID=2762759 RepID=UPI001642C30D|nr:MurR/RpiR family transcriptional regulator [Pseudonocardia sp. C8]MBC3191084.1 MurR/RpiR family transcriptional regulator [Pseudonocardia sp. C8]
MPERIRVRFDLLSSSQRKIARYCLSRPGDAGTLTALRIAEQLGVSESTVVRFAIKLGYDGFPSMQEAIRSEDHSATMHDDQDVPADPVQGTTSRSLRNDLDVLGQSIAELDLRAVGHAVRALSEADRILVCGFRTSFSLAHLAHFHLRKVHRDTRLLDDLGGTLVDDLELVRGGDAVWAFTFPVYDERTIQVVNHAESVGASSVVVTDSALAPLPIGPSIHPLMVRHDSVSFFNTTVAAVALVNAVVSELTEIRTRNDPMFARQLSRKFHTKGQLRAATRSE